MSLASLKRADARGNEAISRALQSQQSLAEGTTANAVKWLERMLRTAGFDPGVQDTKFTAQTAKALRAFQKARGLSVTGQLDAKTFAALKAVQTRVRNHHGRDVFGVGQRDAEVKTAEKRLARLGYDVGKIDGTFDAKTKAAVEQFQRDQGKADVGRVSGVLGERAQASLQRETKALSHTPWRGRVTQAVAQKKRLDAETAREAKKLREVPVLDPSTGAPKLDAEGNPVTRKLTGLMLGDEGRAVKNLQLHLKRAGFDPKGVDGRFDARTEGALKAFQQRMGLEATGRLGPGTWRALSSRVIYAKNGTSPAQNVGEKSAAVKRSEELLKKLGLNPGKVDGLFDARTRAASRKFERMYGMAVDGAIGAGQLAKMKQAAKDVTLGQLRAVMPLLSEAKARAYLPLLNRAMAEAQITTTKRKAMFLAQLAHESVQLRYFEEIASGAAYEGRRDLGNVRPGDGVRYKGRGPIQITGRANYRAAGKALGLPLEANPKMASRPSVGFRIAAWYWKSRGLNAYADRGDFRGVTLRINGGYNGYSDRLNYYRKALRALT